MSTTLRVLLYPAITPSTGLGLCRLTWTVMMRASPGTPRESKACAESVYVPSRTHCDAALKAVPKSHWKPHSVGPPPASPPLKSTDQRTDVANVLFSLSSSGDV